MADKNGTAIVEIKDMKKAFGNQSVLKGVSFKLAEGENIAVVGKSGAGKSVLLKCLVRLIKYDAGSVKVFDKSLAELNAEELLEARRNIGFLFQGGALYDSMTVRENLEFPLKRMPDQQDRESMEESVKEALESVGLTDAIDKMPSELSGGMQKRVALARTMILEPKILLYDEPTAGLDPVTSKQISKLLAETQQQHNNASITITHDLSSVEILADRVLYLKEGKIEAEGTIDDLKQSEDKWLRNFFNT